MTLEEYKKSKGGHTTFKILKKVFTKICVCGIIVLSILIICNLSDSTKNLIKKELFETNLDFSKVNKLYSKFFSINDTEPVSLSTEIDYSNYEKYKDGISISTSLGENVSLMDSGIVVFIGEKEGYGNTLIVQQSNGVDVWYGNIDNVEINLYDYVNKGQIVATSKDKLYLVLQKDGEYLNYKEYIK